MNRNRHIKIGMACVVGFISLWLFASFVLYAVSGFIIYRTEFSRNAEFKVPLERVFVDNENGDRLEFIWIDAGDEGASGGKTYVYLHGNAGRLPYIVEGLAKHGNVLSPAYPGFAGSEGKPGTDAIYEVVDLSMEFLKGKGISDGDVVIFGHSLGGSPAMYAAMRYPDVGGVILVNTFYSMRSMCGRRYKILCLFSGGMHNTAEMAPRAMARIRQFHNPDDELIPRAEGERLFDVIGSEDKMLFDISGSHATFPVDEVLEKSGL